MMLVELDEVARRVRVVEAWGRAARAAEFDPEMLRQAEQADKLVTLAEAAVRGENGGGGEQGFLVRVVRGWGHDVTNRLSQVLLLSNLFEGRPGGADWWQARVNESLGSVVETCEVVEKFLWGELPSQVMSGKQVKNEVMKGVGESLGESAWRFVTGGWEVAGEVRCHPAVLAMLGENLGQNLLRHVMPQLERGARGLELSLSVEESGKMVDFCIVDNGPGYSEARLTLGFVPGESTCGRGIGMACNRELLERYGGDLIPAERRDGQRGARTIIRLPYYVGGAE